MAPTMQVVPQKDDKRASPNVHEEVTGQQIEHAKKHGKIYVPSYYDLGAKGDSDGMPKVREVLNKQGVTDSTEQDDIWNRANGKMRAGFTMLPRK